MNQPTTPDLSGYSAQVIEENGRLALTFWPHCTKCKSPFHFDAEEPFAYCSCGTTEWGDPRPASWVCPPRQPLNEKVEMNDKTEQAVTDALRLAVKLAAPYGTALIGVGHLNKAADTIENLCAQLAEAQRDAATPTPDAFRKALRLAQRESLDRTGSGVVNWDQADAVMSDEARHLVECYIAAIDAAKGEKNGA